MPPQPLLGRRLLVVEDQAILAMEMETLLTQLGCEIVGPFATLAAALEAARTEQLDGAILDINLDGEAVYPVAEILQSRQITFLLATGYGTETLPPRFANCPLLEKPFLFEDLIDVVTALWA